MNIENLRNKIETEIEHRISSRTFYDVLLTKTLKAKLNHLDEINEILSFDKCKLAFIGTVGLGKTTAICHLFNLLVSHDKDDDNNNLLIPLNKDEINANVEVSEILKTGVGYTTLCEVELQLSDSVSKIRIEPYSEQELIDTLSIFSESIQNSVSPDKDNPNSPGKQIISIELGRAIRNMTKLNPVSQEFLEKGKKITKKIDKCKEEFNKCANVEDFKQLVIQRANITERTKTEICYETLFGDEKVWLKNIFDEINSGRVLDFSLPNKIYISLSKNIIKTKESLFDIFESIIDTKGLDVNENRKDIDNYIKDKKTICVFTTGYKDAPDKNMSNLLDYHFHNRLANYQTKIVIIVLPIKGQPEGEEGANNRDEGIDIRRGYIQDNLRGLGITEIPDSNIQFFDALRYYTKDTNNNKIYFNTINTSVVETDRDDIVLNLLNTIDERKEFYKAEFLKLESDVNQIINGSGLTKEEEELITETKNKINNYANLNFISYKDLTDKFISYYKYSYAAMTIKAINRRFGEFRGIDIFYDAQTKSAEPILRAVTKDYSEKIIRILTDLRNEINNEDIGKLIDEIQTQFHYLYKNFIDDITVKINQFLHYQKLDESEKSDFWGDVIDLKGGGYRERVGATFRDELETTTDSLPNTNEYFKTITEEKWKNFVIANIANYFEK